MQNPITECFVKYDPKTGKNSIYLRYKNSQSDFEIRISPYFGSNIYKYKYNGKDIIYCDYNLLKSRDWTGCFILWPIPNRVRNKKYEFEGKIYSLESIKRKRGNYPLIHGLVDDKIFKIEGVVKGKESVTAKTSFEINEGSNIYKFFPFKSKLILSFTLDKKGLTVSYEVMNLSGINLPSGFALHPYFLIPSGRNNTYVYLPAKHIMETDEQLLPTGKLIEVKNKNFNLNKPVQLSTLSLDHVYTDLSENKIPYIDHRNNKYKILFRFTRDFTHIVLYTAEKSYFCLENQTGSTDMINLHTRGIKTEDKKLLNAAHLIILPPKKKHRGFVHLQIERY
jgi:aldose 1-epimerase